MLNSYLSTTATEHHGARHAKKIFDTWPDSCFFIFFTGCSSSPDTQPMPTSTPTPVVSSLPESRAVTVPPSEMALQLSDMNSDYRIKDRSVISLQEVDQFKRDIGWKEGYFVHFYRLDKDKDDQTIVRQSINIFPLENINKVFKTEKEEMKSRANVSSTFYEIPFPMVGDTSIAFRESQTGNPYESVVYTVLFSKKDVYEKIIMTGSTTDYEALKAITQRAAEKIR
jgi:hypothetical protein